MRERTHRPNRLVLAVTAAALTAAWLSSTPALRAQSAAVTAYQQAQAAEQAARAASPLVPEVLRKVAKQYEAFVLKYPASGRADDALWQGAGLLTTAYQQSADANDRHQAERLLKWLKQEYPYSSFSKRVDGALQILAVAPPSPAPPPTTLVAVSDAAPPAPPVPTSVTPSTAPAIVKSISESALPHGERITIEFSREVSYSGDRVDNPDRVFFDFTNATAPAAIVDHPPAPAGTLIKGMRVGRHTVNVTRVVLELAGNPRYSAFPMYNPFRVVVDVESAEAIPPRASNAPVTSAAATITPAAMTTSDAEPAKGGLKPTPTPETPKPSSTSTHVDADSVKGTKVSPPLPAPTPDNAGPSATKPASASTTTVPAPPSSNSSGDYSLSRQLGLGVSRIVVDAGHGGHDPGAQANGIDEAELTLDVAQRLQKLLEAQPGVEVVLTRNSDEYIPLEERTAIANREGADLFVSIHANASKQQMVSGIETYFLNFATNPTAEAVAARENASSAQTMGTLPDILKAIALNNKLAESRELASIVQTSLVRRLGSQNKNVRDLGVKQAPFVVLIGAQMPSILAEISFVTNRGEAALLKQSSYRQKIAQALCDGIVKYQGSLKKVTTVASKDSGR